MDEKVVEFKLKHILDIADNLVKVKFNYQEWLDNGKFKNHEYELIPESLAVLVDLLEQSKYKTKFSLGSSKFIIKNYPTKEAFEEYLRKDDKIPVDDVDLLD